MEGTSEDFEETITGEKEEVINDPSEIGTELSTVLRLHTDSDPIPPPGPNDTYKGLIIEESVTTIPFQVFQTWSALQNVAVSSLTLDVGMSAFGKCTRLESVTMSCTTLRMGASVFDGCTSLETVTFSEGCILMELQNSTFRNCSALKDLRLPASLKTINEKCFENCSSLCRMDLPASLVRIGDSAFQRCSSLRSIVIPGSVIHVCNLAFFECHGLQSVTLQRGLISIADFAFGYCFALESIKIPMNVGAIGAHCFTSCTSLVTIELPPLLKRVDDGVFSDCTSLKRVWVPSTLESIGHHAFRSCCNLVSIEIPQNGNLSFLDTNAMEGCTDLRSMALPPTANPRELTFSNCHAMIRRTKIDLLEALQNRFEGRPVHNMCYHCGKDLTVVRLEDALAADSEESCLRTDKLGLNLLQVLLLSFHPKRGVLLFFIKKYPTSLIPNSFGVRMTIDVSVRRVIDDLCDLNELSTIQDILDVALSHRVKIWGSQSWKNSTYNLVGALSSARNFASRQDVILRILSKVESFDRLETTSLLELAVWKAAFVLSYVSPKKLTSVGREHVRVTNGSNVIIPQVAALLWDVDVD
ncbi:MAG: hypothetical protein SGBAC_008067 [Bacillariaceae sp.]